MPRLERLAERHAPAVLTFETTNREYFARFITDRGDDYFADFADRHAALLAEQRTGACHFHVLVAEDGTVLGRFNLFDVADGAAVLGYRVSEAASGRGVAQAGVRGVSALARAEYGLHRLIADAAVSNMASRAVLRRTGFVPIGDVMVAGQPSIRHVLDLSNATPSEALLPRPQ